VSAPSSTSRSGAAAQPADGADPVFAAFVGAGLWPGLGRRTAAELPAAGIRSPEDVSADRLQKLPRVGRQRAERLFSSFLASQPTYEVVFLLVHAGLEARLAAGVADALGPDAARRLRDDPWALLGLSGVTLTDADRLAIALLPRADRQDTRRGRAVVAHTLRTATRDGHTVLPLELVVAALRAEGVTDPAAAVESAVESGDVLAHEPPEPPFDPDDDGTGDGDGPDDGDGSTGGGGAGPAPTTLSLARYGMAEESVAENVQRLLATAEPIADPLSVRSVAKGLDPAQTEAVAQVLHAGVSLLTGGPGTGKSRTVAAVVQLLRRKGTEVALAAPTGRAAKRLEELTDHPAVTVHRLLGAQGYSGGFSRNEEWPLDAEVVVVDEASMLDVELAAALLEACPDGTHLLLVGDPAQLPSIGPGHVLGDLIASGAVPVTELTTLHRQAAGGAIARLATGVRHGELPPVDSPDREVVVVPATGSAEAARRVVQLVTDSIPRALSIDPGSVQVVTPVHRGPAGTIELNKALKARLNPGDGTVAGFDVGDRVVATANHLDLEPAGFANGEVGVVTGTGDGSVDVAFASGPVTVPSHALGDLRHGWAITVHRAQGSEWPGVVVVLPPEAGGMLSRPLVYTALTRAQRHLSIVHASGAALARAVREVDVRPRRTRLATLLADAS
jgi:exodeoxyribonuclease V alpha subunit